MTSETVVERDRFASRALNVLLERMAESTEELARLRSAFEAGVLDPERLTAHDSPLGLACARVERRGWLFGWVARELGSDVLFECRERLGLQCVLELVGDMLAAEGRTISQSDTPELDSSDPRCNELCAVVARCVYAARAHATLAGWSFARQDGVTRLRFEAPSGMELERELIRSAARLEGSRLIVLAQRSELLLPNSCVVWP
jgi:hypothetical protein